MSGGGVCMMTSASTSIPPLQLWTRRCLLVPTQPPLLYSTTNTVPAAAAAKPITTTTTRSNSSSNSYYYSSSSSLYLPSSNHTTRITTTTMAITPPTQAQEEEEEEEAALSDETRRTRRRLQAGIAEFYDKSSGIWEQIWGEHMHHGFYQQTTTTTTTPNQLSDHRSAQIRMIEQTLQFAQVSDDPMKRPRNIVDVGCGIGGSSRYLAKKYEAESQGITLSPVQAQRAQALATAQGLSDKVSFQVADALNQPFPDGKFDLVWSMESGEHMPDKSKFVSELARVAAPGGTIIIVTWCHRDLSPSEQSLKPDESNLLKKICDAYYLPSWCSAADYVKLLESLSLQDIKTEDWTDYVAPFWPAVIRTALTWNGFTSLLRSGWKTIRGALVMPLMIQGYRKGLIKFAIITCRKPYNPDTDTKMDKQ